MHRSCFHVCIPLVWRLPYVETGNVFLHANKVLLVVMCHGICHQGQQRRRATPHLRAFQRSGVSSHARISTPHVPGCGREIPCVLSVPHCVHSAQPVSAEQLSGVAHCIQAVCTTSLVLTTSDALAWLLAYVLSWMGRYAVCHICGF